ncbi:MAG TPA: hypothetical protein VGK47_03690, partial [Nitrososphaeraceae archaeon]
MIEEDYAIYSAILEPIFREKLELGRKYISPILRGNRYETSGSFSVYEYKDRLYWKDYGHTSQKGHRPVHLIMDIHGLTKEEAEEKLLTLDLPTGVKIFRQSRSTLYMWDRPELNNSELAWWDLYNVPEEVLTEYRVYGTDRLEGEYEGKRRTIFDKDWGAVSFTYRGGKDMAEFQWYQPEQPRAKKNFKRQGNFIYGYDQLPYKAKFLCIVSGMKDGLVFYTATGQRFIAGSGEGAWRQVGKILPELKQRFENIATLFDPDFPGQQ